MLEGRWLDESALSRPLAYDEWPVWLRGFWHDYRLHAADKADVWILRCRHCPHTVLAHVESTPYERWVARVAMVAHQRCHAAGTAPTQAGPVGAAEGKRPSVQQAAVDARRAGLPDGR